MNGGFVNLLDGTRLEVKFNFGTLYYLQEAGGNRLAEKIQEKADKDIKPGDMEMMRFIAKLIYAMLRSNGRKVTFDEALSLVPPDPTEMLEVIEAYQEKMDKIKKKETVRENMKNFTQK